MRGTNNKRTGATRARDWLGTGSTGRRKLTQRYWWLLAQGLLATIFGVMAIFWPKLTIFFFLRLFGAYALFEGLPPLFHATLGSRRRPARGRWILMIEGIVSVAIGAFCLILPRMESRVLFYTIAIWLLLKSFSFLLQTRTRGWLMGVIGALALAAAVYILIVPAAGFRLLLMVVGIFALIMGVLLLIRGWKARSAQRAGDLDINPV